MTQCSGECLQNMLLPTATVILPRYTPPVHCTPTFRARVCLFWVSPQHIESIDQICKTRTRNAPRQQFAGPMLTHNWCVFRTGTTCSALSLTHVQGKSSRLPGPAYSARYTQPSESGRWRPEHDDDSHDPGARRSRKFSLGAIFSKPSRDNAKWVVILILCVILLS